MIALHVSRFMSFGLPLMWNLITCAWRSASRSTLARASSGVLPIALSPARVEPRAIEAGVILLLHQLEAFELVGRRRAQTHRARHAVDRRTS